MRGLKLAMLGGVFLAGLLVTPARADAYSSNTLPVPGTVSYVEGQASIGAEMLNSKSIGAVALRAGQTLTTRAGDAEIYLTPDVLLRVGSNSSVKMISPSISDAEVSVQRGEAEVEVDHIFKQNRLLVRENGVTTRLEKKGLYDFDADQHAVRVLKGQALLHAEDRWLQIKGSHEVELNAPELISQKFNKDSFEANSSLWRWGTLRSRYVEEEQMQQNPWYGWGPWWGPDWGWGPGWGWGPAWGWGPGWWW